MPERAVNYRFIVFALCIVMSFLLEGAVATSHRDHAGDEDNCPICLVDQHIKNLPRQFRSLCSRFAFPLGLLLASAFMTKQFFCSIPASSVKLKIKMNT